ncbi:MAG: diacylglycerol kinase, partial [Verrucomicrobiota bacterium]|nr:diacylglycerol kinase [Verrucomicrobiota bacterium]
LNRLEALVHLPKLFNGTHPTHPKVRYFSGARLEVDSEPKAPLAIDGDVVGFTPATLTIRPGSLPVLVPFSPVA